MKRRSFLGLVGGISAKLTTDTRIARLAGLNNSGLGTSGLGYLSDAFVSKKDNETPLSTALDYIKVIGIPETVEMKMRSDSHTVNHLDPDIACKTSWSMSVKIMTQRERNYQRQLERMHYYAKHERTKLLFKNTLGFEWPFHNHL